MNLGKKILGLRKKKGLSQEQLGERINVTRQTISNWELGETSPNIEQLKLLSKEFNISIDELLDNDVNNILVKKVSNTEKLSGNILLVIKFIFLIFVVGIIIILFYIVMHLFNKEDVIIQEESIYCKIYGEEHGYSIMYNELTGKIIESGGDTYFYDILDLRKYSDVHQIFNIINDYVKRNNGTCEMIENRDLNSIVDMQIKEGSLSSTGLTIIIKENIDYDISYGEPFWIEKYNYSKSSYEKLPIIGSNCAFNLPAYSVKPEKPLELNQNWSCMYGKLSNGIYRIVKDVFFASDVPVSEEDQYYIWTEFEIK